MTTEFPRTVEVAELFDGAAALTEGVDFSRIENGDEYARGIIELLVYALGLSMDDRWLVARLINVKWDADREAVVV
jgi:hypothetical protein